MDTGARRVIAESRFGTVTDRDIHYSSPFSDDMIANETLPIRQLLSISCVRQRHTFLAGTLAAVGIGLIAAAVRALIDGMPLLAVANLAFGIVTIWCAIWQTGIIRVMVTTVDGSHFPIGVGAAWHETEAAILVSAVRSRIAGYDYPGVGSPADPICRDRGRW